MRVVVCILLFFVFDGSFCGVNGAVTTGMNVPEGLHQVQTAASFLETSAPEFPSRPYAPFLILVLPSLLILLVFVVAKQTPTNSATANEFVRVLRKAAKKVILSQTYRLVSPTFFVEVTSIIAVHLIGVVMVLAASAAAFGFPVAGWKAADGFTKFMVSFYHLSLVASTAGGIFLFLLPYIYSHFVRLRRYRVLAPGSPITIEKAMRIVSDYRNVRDMVEEDFKMRENIRVKASVAKATGKLTVPVTLDSWKNADDSREEEIDPIRVLIMFFYPSVMVGRTPVAALRPWFEKRLAKPLKNGEKLLEIDQLLSLVFDFRIAQAKHADVTELKSKLLAQLDAVWRCMIKERKFRNKDLQDPLKSVFQEGMFMGSFPVTILLLLEELFAHVGLGGWCESLDSEEGGVKQGLTWFHLKEEFPYPKIPNSQFWNCPGACTLECDTGYRAVNGDTECSDLGGNGMIWGHLLSDTSEIAACCIHSPDAAIFRSFSLAHSDASSTTLNFTTTETFSIGCGADQSIAIQVCKSPKSTNDWEKEQECSVSCQLDPSTLAVPETASGSCDHVHVEGIFPTDIWNAVANETVALSASSAATFTTDLVAGTPISIPKIESLAQNVLHRMVYVRNVDAGAHVVYGNWMKWSAPSQNV